MFYLEEHGTAPWLTCDNEEELVCLLNFVEEIYSEEYEGYIFYSSKSETMDHVVALALKEGTHETIISFCKCLGQVTTVPDCSVVLSSHLDRLKNTYGVEMAKVKMPYNWREE